MATSVFEKYDPFIITEKKELSNETIQLHKEIRKFLTKFTPLINFYTERDTTIADINGLERFDELIKKYGTTYTSINEEYYEKPGVDHKKNFFNIRKGMTYHQINSFNKAYNNSDRKVDTLNIDDSNIPSEQEIKNILNYLYTLSQTELVYIVNPAFFKEIFEALGFKTYYVKYYMYLDMLVIKVFERLDEWIYCSEFDDNIAFVDSSTPGKTNSKSLPDLLSLFKNLRFLQGKHKFYDFDAKLFKLLYFLKNKKIGYIKRLIKENYDTKIVKSLIEICIFILEMVNYNIHILNKEISEYVHIEAHRKVPIWQSSDYISKNYVPTLKKYTETDICNFINSNKAITMDNHIKSTNLEDYSKILLSLNPIAFSDTQNLSKYCNKSQLGGGNNTFIHDKKTNCYVQIINFFIEYFDFLNFKMNRNTLTLLHNLLNKMNEAEILLMNELQIYADTIVSSNKKDIKLIIKNAEFAMKFFLDIEKDMIYNINILNDKLEELLKKKLIIDNLWNVHY